MVLIFNNFAAVLYESLLRVGLAKCSEMINKTMFKTTKPIALLLVIFVLAGCSARTPERTESQSLTSASAAAIGESARTFMRTVAHDVPLE